jgi:RNA ligase
MFTLQEAISAIKNKPEFTCNKREFGFVIDYNYMDLNTFTSDDKREEKILKNLRGTCFDHSGKIIRLAFDKFHNYNECPGWMESDIDFSKPHHILEKLDGSMIAPIKIGDSFKLGTRAGITDVADMAQTFLDSLDANKRNSYISFINNCIDIGITPIFEFCSRENVVVIDHPEPKLVLIGARYNSGEYLDYAYLKTIGKFHQIPVVHSHNFPDMDYVKAIEIVKSWGDSEGVVITFEDGFRVKVKADDYCKKHRAIDNTRSEKNVLILILDGLLDDILPILDEKKRAQILEYRGSLFASIKKCEGEIHQEFDSISKATSSNRKEFALLASKSVYRQFLFSLLDSKEVDLISYVKSKTSTNKTVEDARFIIGRSYSSFA